MALHQARELGDARGAAVVLEQLGDREMLRREEEEEEEQEGGAAAAARATEVGPAVGGEDGPGARDGPPQTLLRLWWRRGGAGPEGSGWAR